MGEEKLSFTQSFIIFGNLAVFIWIFIAFASILFYSPILSWLYLLALAFTIYGILRRLGCNSCYRCKKCTGGFGRLAGAFFGRGFVKAESVGNQKVAFAFTYVLLLVIPAAILVLRMTIAFSVVEAFVLACLLAVSVYSLSTWFNRSPAI